MLHAPQIPLMGYPLLYLPILIVWIELIIHPTAMLVFQNLPSNRGLAPVEKHRKPRFFSSAEWARIGIVGAVATAIILGGFICNLGPELDVAHARSMAMAALVIANTASRHPPGD